MHKHHIEEMVQALVDNKIVKDEKLALSLLEKYWSDKIADVWDTADVIGHAEVYDIELSEDDAKKVLNLMFEASDAEVGITWCSVDAAIEEFQAMRNTQKGRN